MNAHSQPPRWADLLLETFVAPDLLEDVQGDLHEVFYKRVAEVGLARARREYALAVVRYLRPFFLNRKQSASSSIKQSDMVRSYFKIAFRNITRHKAYSFVNIAGLTLGLTACLLISLFVWDETRYDLFLTDGARVFRVYNEHTDAQGTIEMAVAPPMYTTTLQTEFPEVEKTARIMMTAQHKTLFESGNTKSYEENGLFIDSTFFEVFPLPFRYGSPVKALDDRASIVISPEMAQRFFHSEDVVGKQILMNKQPYLIKGVVPNHPKFHLQFDYIIPLAAIQLPAERMQSWRWNQFYNYVKVKKGVDIQPLERKFQALVKEKNGALC
ncbi:permease prefix domain 2-containing transporter [Larkinella rosea]|uniref:permease prefix domain 2-containing transporter n=1 Tax=Larkinella rosea TaxID=2025312 RepID=UPI001E54BD55|nr:permease prefix domain 2-containing transporter [Larkinella rosea]